MTARPRFITPAAAAFALALVGRAPAQTSYPMVTHATPVAVQRGRTAEVTVEGQMNLFGVYKALFEGAGVRAEVMTPPPARPRVPPPNVRSVKLKVTVAPDAALGVREFRLASSLGVSSLGELVVVDDPVILEKILNDKPSRAQPVKLPCTLCGRIESVEDLDYFRFHAQAGQALTFEVWCARLQDKIHDLQKHADPLLTVYDADGRELASNDDFYFADPLLAFTVPKTGDYLLQIRDAKYDGDPRWAYAIIATDRPYASNVFPMAGNPGQAIDVQPVGSAGARAAKVKVRVPAEPGIHEVRLEVAGTPTNPVTLISTTLPTVTEREPNDTPAQATRVAIPCGINGRIGSKRDLDHFVFKAKRGQALRFEVKARRFATPLRSSLDSVLDVLTPKGDVLTTNDDTFGKDAALVFTPPADGDYVLRIRDLNSKGGPNAVYFIEADYALPDFTLRCDPDKAMLGPGGSNAWYVHVTRENGFAGPVRVEVKDLPRGVTASPLTIPPTMTQGLVVLTAEAGAPRDARDVHIMGTATAKGLDGRDKPLAHTARAEQEIYMPGGGRSVFPIQMQTVGVNDPGDILKVDVSTRSITLKPGGEARIDVTLQRRPDYTKPVTLDVLLQHLGSVFGNPLPPGVKVVEGKSKTLLGAGSKGSIVLQAAPDAAPIDNVPISVQAYVSINFVVKVGYSSPPILLSVRK